MGRNDPDSGETIARPQGDPRLLESDVARRLLTCTIPARVAYLAVDGTPRVVPTWFHWTGDKLVMPTFLSAPHVRHPTDRLDTLRADPDVAITIHTEGFPLSARSAAALTVTGLLVVGLGAVLRSTAATVTTAVAVLFAPRSWGPGVQPAHRDGPGLPPGRTE